jgi:hypothetical protein
MGADSIVDFFPVAQLPIEFFHFQRAGRDLVEWVRLTRRSA